MYCPSIVNGVSRPCNTKIMQSTMHFTATKLFCIVRISDRYYYLKEPLQQNDTTKIHITSVHFYIDVYLIVSNEPLVNISFTTKIMFLST